MPVEPSFMVDEPSVGPVPAQTTFKSTSSMSRAEIAAGVEQKTISNDPLVLQLAATSVSTSIFICDDTYQIASCTAVAETLGGAASTVTVERLTGVQVPGAGVSQLTAPLALNSVAHQVQTGALKTNPDTFAKGDRVGIALAGTLTGLVGAVTVTLKRV
jgi:hypothetical protein